MYVMIKKNALKDDSTRQALIAKLMATENIDVRFERISSAAFDLESRQLILPIYENLTDNVYSMMIAHEVSHALNTPNEGWKETIGNDARKMAYLNIIEDARIERLIKRRYPGVVKDFDAGYKELHDRDFFGLKEKNVDIASLPLIDRLNLYFKSYGNITVPFAENEKVWVNRVSGAVTFEDVVAIAEELYDSYSNPPEPSSPDSGEENSEENEDGSDEGEGSDSESTESGEESGSSNGESGDDFDGSDSDNDGSDSGADESDSDNDGSTDSASGSSADSGDDAEDSENGSADTESGEGSDSKESGSNDNASDGVDEDDSDNDSDSDSDNVSPGDEGSMNRTPSEAPEPMTQENFEEALKNNAARENSYNHYDLGTGYVVDRVFDEHWTDYIDGVDVFLNEMRNEMRLHTRSYLPYSYGYRRNNVENPFTESDILSYYKILNKKNSKVINHMIKEFELKKSAAEHRRTMTSKTGNIDMDRLYNYKITDDIFLSHEVTPDGKNHGVIILIDFSGSMNGGHGFGNNRIQNTMNQVFNFAAFCRKVGIPYRVFGFTNTMNYVPEDRGKRRNEIARAANDEANGPNEMYYLHRDAFRLIEIVNSSMRKNDWLLAMGYIAAATGTIRTEDVDADYVFDTMNGWLGGTPLNAALYLMPSVIRDFIEKNRLDKTIFMLFTDGGAGDTFAVNRLLTDSERNYYGVRNQKYRSLDIRRADTLVDPRSKDYLRSANFRHFNDMLQTFLTRRIRLLTGAKVMGYDIRLAGKSGARDINYDVKKVLGVENDWSQDRDRERFYKDNGFFHLTDLYDFDSFTFISEGAKVEDATIETEIRNGDIENASRRALENAFIRANKKTNDSRFLVKKLMEVIG